eukprot:COSAG01_NODE_2025_length_8604_cov_16.296296_9_plen_77_part_00
MISSPDLCLSVIIMCVLCAVCARMVECPLSQFDSRITESVCCVLRCGCGAVVLAAAVGRLAAAPWAAGTPLLRDRG